MANTSSPSAFTDFIMISKSADLSVGVWSVASLSIEPQYEVSGEGSAEGRTPPGGGGPFAWSTPGSRNLCAIYSTWGCLGRCFCESIIRFAPFSQSVCYLQHLGLFGALLLRKLHRFRTILGPRLRQCTI